jgi:hypothetical protein
MIRVHFCSVLFVLIVLTGCGKAPTVVPAKEAADAKAAIKEPTLYSAKQCFSGMLGLAQRWHPDALPFHMESEWNSEATGQGGKATVWRAYFASLSHGTMKSFVCSGSRLLSSPPVGFTDTPETPYAANVPGLLFQPFAFLTDSDKAFAVTLEHGGASLIQKNPQQPVVYLLDWDPKKKEILWSVIYGKNLSERQGFCAINAMTGSFVSAG